MLRAGLLVFLLILVCAAPDFARRDSLPTAVATSNAL